MNVPSKCSYQSTCVTRTVQSIDKNKQKNAGVRRYNTVSNRVSASTCCNILPSCPPPTAGEIIPSNCSSDGQYTTTCNYTVTSSGGTSFQWYYAVAPSYDPVAFVDGPRISGSQTPTLRMGATDNFDVCRAVDIYCIVTNSCGSVQSNGAPIVGGCPILE